MAGPAKPTNMTTWKRSLPKGNLDMPGRVFDPESIVDDELYRAARIFNEERDYKASANHRPRKVLTPVNVYRRFRETAPTRDDPEIDPSNLDERSGLQMASSNEVIAKVPKTPPGVDPSAMKGLPSEFAGRPKLTMLWLKGQGKLPPTVSKSIDKHMAEGNMRLSEDDWIALETMIPSQSAIMNWPKEKIEAFNKRYGNVKGPVDPYLRTLVADVNRKMEVDKVMAGVKTTAMGVFGIFGGGIGSAVGPGGTIVGGGLGVMAGATLTDGVSNLSKMVLDKIYPNGQEFETGRYKSATKIMTDAVTEGAIDVATGGLGIYAGTVAKKMGQKILGIGHEGRMTQAVADKLGVSTLPVQVGGDFWVGATNVLARMPLIGGPLRKKLAEQNLQIENFLGTLPGRMSTKNFSTPDVGVEMDILAQNAFENTMTVLRGKQTKLMKDAAKLGAFVNTGDTRRVAEKWLNVYASRDVAKPDQWVIDKLQAVADSAQGKVTLEKWDTDIASGIRTAAGKLEHSKGEGSKAFEELLDVAKDDLRSSGFYGKKQMAMDNEFNAGLDRFQTVAAKKFEMLDKNRFREGVMKLGSKNPDELVGMLSARNSPKFVYDIRQIIGDDAMRDLGSRYMAGKIGKSKSDPKSDGLSIDFNKLASELGLDDPKGNKFGVTKEMIRNSGVDMAMLQDFMKVAKASSRAPVPKGSTFMARALVFGGYSSAITALTLNGAMGPGLVAGTLFTLLARKGAKILADPEMIRLATIGADVKADAGLRRTSVLRLYRMVAPEAFEGGQEHGIPEPAEAHQHMMNMGRSLVR